MLYILAARTAARIKMASAVAVERLPPFDSNASELNIICMESFTTTTRV